MFPLSLHSEKFLSEMDAVFCQMLSLHLLRRYYGSCFTLADMMNHIDCFMSVEPALHPGDKSHLVIVNNLLNVSYCILLASILLRIFASMFISDIGL